MSEKLFQVEQVKKHAKSFLVRWASTVFVLLAILFVSSLSNFYRYGFNMTGSRHHLFLDFPNEISSVDAVKLSGFMEHLYHMFDKKIKQPMEKEHGKYWEAEVDVKDRYKRSQVIQAIAQEIGLSPEKFPLAHQHHVITDKIKSRLKNNIAFPPDYLKMKKPPRPHVPRCDTTKLHHHKTTLMHFSSQQYKKTIVKVDGSFSDGGKINVRVATPEEDSQLKHNIRVNLTLYAKTSDLFERFNLSQIDCEATSTKRVYMTSHSSDCLVYNLDIVLPTKLGKYKDLDIKANHASSVSGDLKGVEFESLTVGLGRGAIHLKNAVSDEIWLGTFNGIILGHYLPKNEFGAASVKGATIVDITPQSKKLKATVASLEGPVKATLTDDGIISKEGGFIAHCWLCEPAIVADVDPKNIHITSAKRPSIKTGYYKKRSGVHINVHSKFGESKLLYL